MRESLAAYEAIGGALYGPELHGLLGIGMDRPGQAAEALQAVTDALRKAEQSQDRWWRAELHRLKGELTLALAGRSCRRSGGGVRASGRACARTAGEVLGAARRHEPRAPVAPPGKGRPSAAAA